MSTKICSYNVENLFSRPKVLNLKDNDQVSLLLQQIARFKELMEKDDYGPHKAEILQLWAAVHLYVELNVRSRAAGVPRDFLTEAALKAKGRGDWEGFIEFRRAEFSGEQVDNTARVIKAIKPDIMGFVEVENRSALGRFDTDVLNNLFEDMIVIDGNDPREIDVAMAARKGFRFKGVSTNVLFRDDKPGYVFSRDCLVGVFEVNGKTVTIMQNHFKAKDATPKVSDEKRRRQAAAVRWILTNRYDLKKDRVIVMGDFNDEPESRPLQELVTTPDLHNVFDVVGIAPDDRWTYYYGSKKQRNKIDMMFVSEALRAEVAAAGIERRGIADLDVITGGKQKQFKEVTSWRVSGSDHAAIWAELNL